MKSLKTNKKIVDNDFVTKFFTVFFSGGVLNKTSLKS